MSVDTTIVHCEAGCKALPYGPGIELRRSLWMAHMLASAVTALAIFSACKGHPHHATCVYVGHFSKC